MEMNRSNETTSESNDTPAETGEPKADCLVSDRVERNANQSSGNCTDDEAVRAGLQSRFTVCNYSPLTTAIMLGMVVAGAGRSVAVKAYFQSGFESPLLVTILYLLGSFLCVFPYYAAVAADKYWSRSNSNQLVRNEISLHEALEEEKLAVGEEVRQTSSRMSGSSHKRFSHGISPSTGGSHISLISLALSDSSLIIPALGDASVRNRSVRVATDNNGGDSDSRRWMEGSRTGLTSENELLVSQWVDKVPLWAAPIVPAFCNILKSFMRWAALIYISASVAEILIGGLELVFIVFAARLVRKRAVSKLRWLGVIIVCFGIVIVGCTDVIGAKDDASDDDGSDNKKTGVANSLIGISLVVGQCLVSVVQDILEEIFIQIGEFPALLFVGIEGAIGVVIGIAVYYPATLALDEDFQESWSTATDSGKRIGFLIGLTLLFMVAAVFNILACAATSSMTRNMWGSTFRTAFVWLMGLVIYYSSEGDSDIGEKWDVPESFVILIGFGVILYGLHTYYKEATAT